MVKPLSIQGGQYSGNIRSEIGQILCEVLPHCRFCFFGEFNAILRKYNLATEENKPPMAPEPVEKEADEIFEIAE